MTINYANLNIWLLVYLVLINALALFFYGFDKMRAIQHKWRVSEDTLIGLAAVGGALGALVGMFLFHHKTRKLKFLITVPALLIVWVWLLARMSM